ncbi:cell division control protein Cdc6 [archaeon]|nr:cell division control protein Cdc6 [archaeon]
MKKGLNDFFENYLGKDPLFLDKKCLQANYTPNNIPHREEQINQLASILAPALRMEKPSNVFCYGKSGSGKSLCSQYVLDQILDVAKKKKLNVNGVYLNCKLKKVSDTEYRLLAALLKTLDVEVPTTGLPTQDVYKMFTEKIDKEEQLLILILDEIDQLVNKIGDEILYNLTRLNSELKKCQIIIVGVSNNLMFTDNLDPRVRSSLSEEEIVFPPYNALQIQDILKERVKVAFKKDSIENGVIEKCAAYAAREHGDARRALELLRVSGELTERDGKTKIKIKYIDDAEEKIEKDRVLDVVRTQPKQSQIALYSIMRTSKNSQVFTGDIFEHYKEVCNKVGLKPLTQRRISDIISELDMLGIIHAKIVSKGRYGRSKEISVDGVKHISTKIDDILKESLGL